MSDWFVNSGGKTFGPFDSAKLRRLAAAGKVTASDRVRRGHDGSWQSASKVKGLFPDVPTTPVVRTEAPTLPPVHIVTTPAPQRLPVTIWGWWQTLSPIRRRRVWRRVLGMGCVLASLVLIVARFHTAYSPERLPSPAVPPPVAESPSELAKGLSEIGDLDWQADVLDFMAVIYQEMEQTFSAPDMSDEDIEANAELIGAMVEASVDPEIAPGTAASVFATYMVTMKEIGDRSEQETLLIAAEKIGMMKLSMVQLDELGGSDGRLAAIFQRSLDQEITLGATRAFIIIEDIKAGRYQMPILDAE